MNFLTQRVRLVSAVVVALSVAVLSSHAHALFIDPCAQYPVDSKKWKKCKGLLYKPSTFQTDEQRYMAGYWLAKNGRYQEAITILSEIRDRNNARAQNYLGYATRKLGNVNKALVYYRRAVSIDPDYVMARSYMGEAFLAKGEIDAARDQLAEIAARCGSSCEAYTALADAIAVDQS